MSQCPKCIPLLPYQRLEEQIQTKASRPFEAVSTDLGYYKGMHYLVIVYRYSGWPLVKPLKKLDTTAMTSTLEDWFLDYGKPVDIRSDGGPQFRPEFDIWYQEQKIKHQSSSAYNHQSNGHAEVAVREMKHSFKKTGSFMESRRALREWRAQGTQGEEERSP